MMKPALIFSILFLTLNSLAALKNVGSKALKKPIYLGKTETRLLQRELSKANFTGDTFSLTFRCDKFKKNPSAKKRSLNCLAVSVSPDLEVKTLKKK